MHTFTYVCIKISLASHTPMLCCLSIPYTHLPQHFSIVRC